MRHLTRTPSRPDGRHRRRAVLAGAVTGVLVLGSAPVAALDGGDDGEDGEVETSSVTSSTEDDGEDSLDGLDATDDGSGDDGETSSSSLEETVDDTTETVDSTVEETVDETEESLSEVTGTLTEDEDGDEEPEEEPEEPEENDGADDGDEDPDDEGSDEDEDAGDSKSTEKRAEPRERSEPEARTQVDAEEADEEEEDADEDDGDDEPKPLRYLDGGPFDPPAPRAPAQLLRTGYEPFDFDLEVAQPLVAESSSARDTGEIIGMLQGADASESTVARVMAPFPLAGPASYGNDGTHEVKLRTTQGTPVVSAGSGEVAVTDAANGVAVELTGHDGTTYRYEGMREGTLSVADGDEVRFGQTLGSVAGFDLDGPSLTFALWSPEGEQLPALHYLDRWLDEAKSAAGELAGAHEGTFAPDVAPPAEPETELAAPDEGPVAQSRMSPAGADGITGIASLGGMLGAALVAYLALRTRRRPLLTEDREGFLDTFDELESPR